MPACIDKDIYEIAFLVEPKKLPVKIKTLNLYLYYSSVDSCLFRINIYENSAGHISKNINKKIY